ncbi:MAG: ArsR family transcriptional regulator [Dehalococcoidia bacterium]|nr:ArsR family transcriptional regulator [Dehalococcoidia bacterium]
MPAGNLLSILAPTRRRLLLTLKRRGEQRTEELAAALEISVSAVRQQMLTLSAEGLVARREVAGGRGRPKLVCRLTPAGERLFPSDDAGFSLVLLGEIARNAGDHLEAAIDRWASERVAAISARSAGLHAGAALRAFLAGAEDEGYLVELREGLEQQACAVSIYSCPILRVARALPRVCVAHAAIIATAARVEAVQQRASLLDGSPACEFLVAPPRLA